MSEWKIKDIVCTKRGSLAMETVVYVGDGFVVTVRETTSGIKAICRTDAEMECFVEKVV